MIYALKVNEENRNKVYDSLLQGEGRFGWSYKENANLLEIKKQIEDKGWSSLDEQQKHCYHDFLLAIEPEDYVVYINMPKYGHCTLAKVNKGYYWRFDDTDFNHRFGVDPDSIRTFDRNGDNVHPNLRARLKLQGKYWRIHAKEEFYELVKILKNEKEDVSTEKHSYESNIKFLNQYMNPLLTQIANQIHKAHPNYDLERLMAKVFENVPNVINVELNGGAGDKGADLLVTYKEGLPISGLESDAYMAVQVKSFEGAHHDTGAINDIIRAYKNYPNIKTGLIISTATSLSKEFEEALEKANENLAIPISILYGSDLSLFILKHAVL